MEFFYLHAIIELCFNIEIARFCLYAVKENVETKFATTLPETLSHLGDVVAKRHLDFFAARRFLKLSSAEQLRHRSSARLLRHACFNANDRERGSDRSIEQK